MAENTTSEANNTFKVSLRRAVDYPNANNTKEGKTAALTSRVVFDVTPDLVETRSVTYKDLSPVHMPGTIYVYGNTSARTFALSNIRLVSRTVDEATRNMQTLWTLRSWTMPHFGDSSTLGATNKQTRLQVQNGEATEFDPTKNPDEFAKSYGQELLGLPPAVLFLNAYTNLGDLSKNATLRPYATHLHKVPVVITSLTIPYPSDVDYIPTIDGQPMPRVMVIDISLNESQAPRALEEFSLQKFRTGRLVGF